MTNEEFMKLTQNEINEIPDEVYKTFSSEVKHSCDGCYWMTAALHWWCTNKECCDYRGTSIPGIVKCKFWKKRKTTIEIIYGWFKRSK